MRTIRDNYYVVTGHTYEEYCKKYRRGIGKGRLLSFSEDEVKYLKKNKHYWEVIGPHGKTLYCQVSKLKPKHIIIPSVMAVAIAGGVLGGIYIPKLLQKKEVFTGEVTETEWKASFEDICNVYERKTLNYTTTGSMTINSVGVTTTYKNLKVDDKYEEVEAVVDGGKTETIYTYNFHQVPIQYDTKKKDFSSFLFVRDYLGNLFEGIYDAHDKFTFDNNEKVYTIHLEESLLTNKVSKITYDVGLKFSSDKKIKKIQSVTKEDDTEVLTCDYEYTYGNASITPWDKEILDAIEQRAVNFTIADGGKSYLSPSFNHEIGQKIFCVLNKPKTIENLNSIYLCDSDSQIIQDLNIDLFAQVEIYRNGAKLERRGNYTGILDSKEKVIGYKLTKTIESTDELTFVMTPQDSLYSKGYHFEVRMGK